MFQNNYVAYTTSIFKHITRTVVNSTDYPGISRLYKVLHWLPLLLPTHPVFLAGRQSYALNKSHTHSGMRRGCSEAEMTSAHRTWIVCEAQRRVEMDLLSLFYYY